MSKIEGYVILTLFLVGITIHFYPLSAVCSGILVGNALRGGK